MNVKALEDTQLVTSVSGSRIWNAVLNCSSIYQPQDTQVKGRKYVPLVQSAVTYTSQVVEFGCGNAGSWVMSGVTVSTPRFLSSAILPALTFLWRSLVPGVT